MFATVSNFQFHNHRKNSNNNKPSFLRHQNTNNCPELIITICPVVAADLKDGGNGKNEVGD